MQSNDCINDLNMVTRLRTRAPIASVFAALGDPTRTRIVDLLKTHGELRVSELSDAFSSTRQTVTRHLDILCEAGLARSEWRGRERFTRLAPEAFRDLREWMADYDRFWDRHLGALKQLAENLHDD